MAGPRKYVPVNEVEWIEPEPADATGGLATSESRTPASMSASSAANNRRSVVHHQAAKCVRSSRETIGFPDATVVPMVR